MTWWPSEGQGGAVMTSVDKQSTTVNSLNSRSRLKTAGLLSREDQGLILRVEGSSGRGTIPLALVQISSRESLLKTS